MADDRTEFDRMLSCVLVSQSSEELARLDRLPDVLERMGLFWTRTILLYRLGHLALLRSDGSIPDEASDEEVEEMVVMTASQPAATDGPQGLVLNDLGFSGISTRVLGVDFEVLAESSSEGFLFSQTYASALEAFAATLLGAGAYPFTDRQTIRVARVDALDEGGVELGDDTALVASIPSSWHPSDPATLAGFNQHLIETCVHALMNVAAVPDVMKTIQELVDEERALERATIFCHAGITRHRVFGSAAARISDWDHLISKSYPLKYDSPDRPIPIPLKTKEPRDGGDDLGELDNHRSLEVQTIINMKLWNDAWWQGMIYAVNRPGIPPIIGLFFENGAAGDAIFKELHQRIGRRDEEDKIYLSVPTGIDRHNPTHYRAFFTQDRDTLTFEPGIKYVSTSKMVTIPAASHIHIETFMAAFRACGCYLLAPAVLDESGAAQFHMELAILKRKFFVKDAWQIGPDDIDATGILTSDEVLVPDGVVDPPIEALLAWRAEPGNSPSTMRHSADESTRRGRMSA